MLNTPEVIRQSCGFALHEAPKIGALTLHFARQPIGFATRSLRRIRDSADSFVGVFTDPKHATHNALLATLDLTGMEADYRTQLANGDIQEQSAEVKFTQKVCDRTLEILQKPAAQRTDLDRRSLVHAYVALHSAPNFFKACKHLSADDLMLLTAFAFPSSTSS